MDLYIEEDKNQVVCQEQTFHKSRLLSKFNSSFVLFKCQTLRNSLCIWVEQFFFSHEQKNNEMKRQMKRFAFHETKTLVFWSLEGVEKPGRKSPMCLQQLCAQRDYSPMLLMDILEATSYQIGNFCNWI